MLALRKSFHRSKTFQRQATNSRSNDAKIPRNRSLRRVRFLAKYFAEVTITNGKSAKGFDRYRIKSSAKEIFDTSTKTSPEEYFRLVAQRIDRASATEKVDKL